MWISLKVLQRLLSSFFRLAAQLILYVGVYHGPWGDTTQPFEVGRFDLPNGQKGTENQKQDRAMFLYVYVCDWMDVLFTYFETIIICLTEGKRVSVSGTHLSFQMRYTFRVS